MKEVQVFNFDLFKLRSVNVSGEQWYVMNDVAEILDVKNPRDVIRRLDDDEKGVDYFDTPGGMQKMNVVTESGVYAFISASKKPEAEDAKRWLRKEVLPSIRKTGGYQIKVPDDPMQQIVLIAQGTTKLDERVRKTENDIEFLKNDSPLPAGQYNKVGSMVSNAIHEYVKIHGLPSSAQGKLRKDISNQINSLAGIRTRTQLRIKDFEPVCQLIEHWVPTTVTRMQLQTELDMEAM